MNHSAVAADSFVNVASRLTEMARRMPDAVAVAMPGGRDRAGKRAYKTMTFAELDRDSDRIATGLRELGVEKGTRIALLTPPSIDFNSLVFALLKSGAVMILIDPGMGRRNLVGCLREAAPEGMIAIPIVHCVRRILRRTFRGVRINVTVGPRRLGNGVTLDEVRNRRRPDGEQQRTRGADPAAIIFTTGSTGPPKGVLYCHDNFDRQVTEIRDRYGIEPGEVDLPGFPLFGLFNCAMGVTTVIPDMDPTRPAKVDPKCIVEAVDDWSVTQAFGSPAIWRRVGQHCTERKIRLSSLRRVLSAGAPVPPRVLREMKACIHPDGEVHTPYGATEALPVATISASEVLDETAARTAVGGGTCVGRRFAGILWKVIDVSDAPIASIEDVREMPRGEIGELIVQGDVVTRRYVTRVEANPLAKIDDGANRWHRMGDLGYLDDDDRFWFCGRKAHRVMTTGGPLYTVPCEAIFNNHADVFRSALVGIGAPGIQRPVVVIEPLAGRMPRGRAARQKLLDAIRQVGERHEMTHSIHDFLIHPSFPVDIRHNVKIFREQLASWATRKLGA